MKRSLFALLLLWALAALLPARAQEAASGLASNSFDDIRHGVETLATSGDPRAADILSALQDGRLRVTPDHTLVIQQADGGFVAADTGAAIPAPDDSRVVRLNNGVRRAIDTALGLLQLFDKNVSVRASAAEAVFHARDATAVPALDRAIARETDAGVKRTMQQARAAAVLTAPDRTDVERLAAIAILRARGDMDSRAVLSAIPQPSAAVGQAAESAMESIDFSLHLWGYLQDAYYGLSLGSVLLLAAAGLAITFGVMGIINMAHGEMVMLGAYATYVVQQGFQAWLPPGAFGWSLAAAVPVAFLVSGAAGVVIERGLIRYLYGRPLDTLLATFGLSLILQQGIRSIFGATNRNVITPDWMSGATEIGGLQLTYNRLTIIIFSIAVLFALMAVLRGTALGLQMRAVTQNRRMAAAMGIRTPWVDAMTFGLGSGVAGIAGVALSQIDNVSPDLGQKYIIDSFMVVVFGGVGNLWGTAIGALIIGMVNKSLEPVAGTMLGKIAVLVLLILFIQYRPRGLFPQKGRAVEQ